MPERAERHRPAESYVFLRLCKDGTSFYAVIKLPPPHAQYAQFIDGTESWEAFWDDQFSAELLNMVAKEKKKQAIVIDWEGEHNQLPPLEYQKFETPKDAGTFIGSVTHGLDVGVDINFVGQLSDDYINVIQNIGDISPDPFSFHEMSQLYEGYWESVRKS